MPDLETTGTQIEMFEYEFVESQAKENRIWSEGYQHLGAMRYLKFLLLPRTFSPFSKFILWWEFSRVLSIISCIAITPSYYGVLHTFDYLKFLRIFYEIHGLVDMYLRLHIGYYNDLGIYVSHPACTAEWYFKHAMIIDIMSIFPYDWIGLDLLFGRQNQRLTFCVILTLTRSLLAYRPYGLIRYFQYETQFYRFDYIWILIRVLLIGFLLNTYSLIKMLLDCNESESCAKMYGKKNFERWLWGFYVSVCSFSKVTNGLFHIKTVRLLTIR